LERHLAGALLGGHRRFTAVVGGAVQQHRADAAREYAVPGAGVCGWGLTTLQNTVAATSFGSFWAEIALCDGRMLARTRSDANCGLGSGHVRLMRIDKTLIA
jgi:hypothetical protein